MCVFSRKNSAEKIEKIVYIIFDAILKIDTYYLLDSFCILLFMVFWELNSTKSKYFFFRENNFSRIFF